jgi:hypothetical protein
MTLTAERRISLIRQYMTERPSIVGLLDPQNVQSRVTLEETRTGPVLQFSTPLPNSLPKPHSGKWQIDLQRHLVKVTLVNSTLIMHFMGFALEIPPAENTAKYTRHTSPVRASTYPPEHSYTRARMSPMRR